MKTPLKHLLSEAFGIKEGEFSKFLRRYKEEVLRKKLNERAKKREALRAKGIIV